MRHNLLIGILLSAAVMVALPIGLYWLAPGDSGMFFAFLLLYLVNPVWSILTGLYGGHSPVRLWPLPLISAGLFVPGMWLAAGDWSMDFVTFLIAYLALGCAAMLISWLTSRRSHASDNAQDV